MLLMGGGSVGGVFISRVVEKNISPSRKCLPPSPVPSSPSSLPTAIMDDRTLYAHILLSLLAVGVALPLSVVLVPGPPYRVRRAWGRVAAQGLFAGLLIAGVGVLSPSFSHPPAAHGVVGYALLAVGLPAGALARCLPTVWRAPLGHAVALTAYGAALSGVVAHPASSVGTTVSFLTVIGLSLTLYVVRLLVHLYRPRDIRRLGRAAQYGPLTPGATVEGSGWSVLLRRNWPSSSSVPTLSTRSLAGRHTPSSAAKTTASGGAGTTIAALQRTSSAAGSPWRDTPPSRAAPRRVGRDGRARQRRHPVDAGHLGGPPRRPPGAHGAADQAPGPSPASE